MEERLVKGEYSLNTSGVGTPPHSSVPSTSTPRNEKIDDVHCACISKLETQVEEQVSFFTPVNCRSEKKFRATRALLETQVFRISRCI